MKNWILFLFVTLFLFVPVMVGNGEAESVNIRSIYVTGGGFSQNEPADPASTNYSPFTHISGDPVSSHPLNTDILMGTFQGSANFGTDGQADKTAGIVAFDFLNFGPTVTFTSPDDLLNGTIYPLLGVYNPPIGTLDTTTGAYTLNLESWTVGWDGSYFNLGTPDLTGIATHGGANGGWDVVLEWSACVQGFNPPCSLFYWRIEGEAFPGGPICDNLVCDDGNLCTTDSCDPLTGCTHTLNCSLPGCDGTVYPPCNRCFVNTDCNDNNPCTSDICNLTTGVCTNSFATGLRCDDGNACTTNDRCQNGGCEPGTPINCDDNVHCTIDSCDVMTGGCINYPLVCPVSETCWDGICFPEDSIDTIRSIYITDGGFTMSEPAVPESSLYNAFTHVSGNSLADGHPFNDDILMGRFQGSPGFDVVTSEASKTTGIVGFDFQLFGPVSGYTSPDAYWSTGIFLPPTGKINLATGEYTLNLESWTVGWNGTEFKQGANNLRGAASLNSAGGWDAVIDWSSIVPGGPFYSQVGYWRIESEIIPGGSEQCLGDGTLNDCDDGDLCTVDTCVAGSCLYDVTVCPGGGACDPIVGCTCPIGGNSVTIRGGGGKPTGTDLEIQTSFTGLMGCILDNSDSTVTVTSGSVLKMDWYQGNGPHPTAVWLDGVLQLTETGGVITCPEVTAETKMILKATNKSQIDTPMDQPVGKDTDRMTIKIVP